MEAFNQKIKDKINLYEYEDEVSDQKVANFFEKLDTQQSRERKVVQIFKPTDWGSSFILKIAASIAILFTASFGIIRFSDVSIVVEKGSTSVIELPDGSEVHLNADSKLKFNKLAWIMTRNVSLDGEAFFDVAEGEKFIVKSLVGSTEVLGTSFNVFAREDRYKVTCFTGSVGVSSSALEDVIELAPGDGVDIRGDLMVKKFNVNDEPTKDWREGEFYFDNEPLREVLLTLSRQYNVEIKLDSKLGNQRYTGYFDNKDLNKALRLICEPIDLTFSIQESIIVIK